MAPVPGSEVFYGDNPPEALDVVEDRSPTVSNGSASSPSRPLSPFTIIVVTAMIVTVLVGVAVGVGVGVGLRKQKSGSSSFRVVASTVTRTASGR